MKLHDNFSVDFWIRPKSFDEHGRIVSYDRPINGSPGSGNKVFNITLAPDGNLYYSHDTGQGSTIHSDPLGELSLDVWTHVTITKDGNTGAITSYLNGVKTVTDTSSFANHPSSNGGDLSVFEIGGSEYSEDKGHPNKLDADLSGIVIFGTVWIKKKLQGFLIAAVLEMMVTLIASHFSLQRGNLLLNRIKQLFTEIGDGISFSALNDIPEDNESDPNAPISIVKTVLGPGIDGQFTLNPEQHGKYVGFEAYFIDDSGTFEQSEIFWSQNTVGGIQRDPTKQNLRLYSIVTSSGSINPIITASDVNGVSNTFII